jgi:hypothetical protein
MMRTTTRPLPRPWVVETDGSEDDDCEPGNLHETTGYKLSAEDLIEEEMNAKMVEVYSNDIGDYNVSGKVTKESRMDREME